MADTGTPPVIPPEFQQYNSYVVDPQWQRKFSAIWVSVLGFFILLSVPHLVRSIRRGRIPTLGIVERLDENHYDSILDFEEPRSVPRPSVLSSFVRRLERLLGISGAIVYWTLPGIGLNTGQLFLLLAYAITVIICIVLEAPLISNSNRAGFIALAQLPVVFLFATKNSIISLLLGPGHGYEKLNFIHRWSGRIMFLAALLHGSLWIRNHLEYKIPIIGRQKETSGIAALGLLGTIILTSLKPVRIFFYEVFYIVHMLAVVAFFVTICYHTIYASPWIFPALAFYGLDILVRMFRHRIKDAILVPVDNQMTLIHVPHATSGWIAGQHIRLRVFFDGRVFESHPLTIFSAQPDISCITSMPQGLSLGARVNGDWTRALNRYATQAAPEMNDTDLKTPLEKDATSGSGQSRPEISIQVMLEGPYGGSGVDLGDYETVLLFAGGSGITFTLGLLDDIVGRCVRKGRKNGERTRRIEFAWCMRSFGAINWFAPALRDIATIADTSAESVSPLDLHISIYVTCLCDPEAVPHIPNSQVTMVRPSVYSVLVDLTNPPPAPVPVPPTETPSSSSSSSSSSLSPTTSLPTETVISPEPEIEITDSEKNTNPSPPLTWVGEGGGVAVCASGPESLTREAANAVARMQLSGRGLSLGGIALHTEVFSL